MLTMCLYYNNYRVSYSGIHSNVNIVLDIQCMRYNIKICDFKSLLLCQFSFYHGVLVFHFVFQAWILMLLEMSHVLVERLCTFQEGCYVSKFVCVDNNGCQYGSTQQTPNH